MLPKVVNWVAMDIVPYFHDVVASLRGQRNWYEKRQSGQKLAREAFEKVAIRSASVNTKHVSAGFDRCPRSRQSIDEQLGKRRPGSSYV